MSIKDIQLGLGAVSALVLFFITWACGCWEDEFDEYVSESMVSIGNVRTNKNRKLKKYFNFKSIYRMCLHIDPSSKLTN